ncbi:MAG: methylated-DNA--[protein]-cysteine S-methyltransferase [Candidatus Eisenbacteria bacterium]|nr:methylated-DNA--[protein]-cysteine S-methyltransferase [Candidatus Eisenbacteria bacterium]
MVVGRTASEGTRLPVLRYVTFDTEIGPFLVAGTDRGLRLVSFGKALDVKSELAREIRGERVIAVEDRIRLRRVVDSIRDYLQGCVSRIDCNLDLSGTTDFNRSVLECVRGIPYGALRSYKWVARAVGHPRATRPVGQALSRNPLPIVIPCHRVVNSDGSLGGYSGGGPDMKRRLIAVETGQVGLALRNGDRAERDTIRFLLEAEGGEREGEDRRRP